MSGSDLSSVKLGFDNTQKVIDSSVAQIPTNFSYYCCYKKPGTKYLSNDDDTLPVNMITLKVKV